MTNLLTRIAAYLIRMLPFMAAALIPLAVVRFFGIQRLRKSGIHTTVRHELTIALFVCYCAGLYGLTLGSLGFEPPRVNPIPFRFVYDLLAGCYVNDRVSAIINIAGNILMFAPVGLGVSLLVKRPSAKKACLYTAAFSLFIELTQLLQIGRVTDIDDLILNTLGGLLGYCVYLILIRIFSQKLKCLL